MKLTSFFGPFNFALVLVMLFAVVGAGCKQEPPKPGQEAFDSANARLTTFESKVGFGNTAEAEQVASKFAQEIVKREAEAFEGGKDAENSLTTQGKWLTYCQVNEGAVVLLVHVPHLDTYEGDERKALAELVWETAAELSAPLRETKEKKVVVALRGNLLFGATAAGSAAGKPSITTGTAVETDSLYPFFASKS